MHVVDMVFFWARAEPHRRALIQPELITTYQGLADAIESICNRIDQLGLDPREPVAVSIANPSYCLATAFALLRCGFSISVVNRPLYPHLRPAGIRNLIYDNEGQVMSGGRNIRFDMSWLPSAAPSAVRKPYRHRPAGGGNLIGFTSGTTGLPKAVVRSLEGLSQRYRSPFTCATGDHRKTLVSPNLVGGIGFNAACEMLYAGKAACFAPAGEATLSLISMFGIEVMVASPQQALALAEFHGKTAYYDLSSLRTVRIGGAHVSATTARRIKDNLCRNIVVWYSSTEAGITAIAPYDMIADIPGAVGFLIPEVEIEIVNETDAVLPVGHEGIIRLRTPQFIANCKAQEPNKPGDASGLWFYPGDIGSLTEDRVLRLAGRRSDVINRGGLKLSAAKIEEILEARPDIKEAGACGIQGNSGLEEIWIAVVPTAPLDVAELKRSLLEHADGNFQVDEVFQVDHLPRNQIGKLQKQALKELLLGLKKGA